MSEATMAEEIEIDPEFSNLIPKADNKDDLESNIIQFGCQDPIVVWTQPKYPDCEWCEDQNPGFKYEYYYSEYHEEDSMAWYCKACNAPNFDETLTILDGHARYAICKKHNIRFGIRKEAFQSRDEAMSWIISRHLCRRNLSIDTIRYLKEFVSTLPCTQGGE